MRRIIVLVLGWLLLPVVLPAPDADAAPGGRYGWPLQPRPPLLRRFDKPPHDWLPGHRGVDLGGADGQPVLAAGDGIVVFAGEVGGKPVVSLDHAGGLRTTYEPVRSAITVGHRIIRGEVLGTLESGHPGCPGACLHWGARRGRDYVDPLGLVRAAPLRLKPVVPNGDGTPLGAAH
ncbi:murein DD-endopeptidase MepM/ murein hydrolase activator NlpD [Nocardia transvalensis]|uniref:Murein DD-endopeptidase MepM/ murein hydrolase activator NlpD n=1 Tax=Nocardia transvalensis TaxID=37333 RepID=A0A7W9P9B8_9NOCA|nr:M23 family metallopeptidase [Nocardia transvalensis]MBB5911573.1 murein DD-endopeptidase MepM/ murein hydrolase activator NlpD [Nocardia transvalensis]